MLYSCDFNPDGTCIATSSHDKKVRIYDIRTKKIVQIYDAHADSVLSVDFHPSGGFLLSTGADSKAKIWDLRMGKLAYTLLGHNG